eukprot:4562118-Prymnesium_polylepis.1
MESGAGGGAGHLHALEQRLDVASEGRLQLHRRVEDDAARDEAFGVLRPRIEPKDSADGWNECDRNAARGVAAVAKAHHADLGDALALDVGEHVGHLGLLLLPWERRAHSVRQHAHSVGVSQRPQRARAHPVQREGAVGRQRVAVGAAVQGGRGEQLWHDHQVALRRKRVGDRAHPPAVPAPDVRTHDESARRAALDGRL